MNRTLILVSLFVLLPAGLHAQTPCPDQCVAQDDCLCDVAGHVVERTEYSYRPNPDTGAMDRQDPVRRFTLQYDDGGFLIQKERDDGINGTVDAVSTFENDPMGNPLVERIDDRADGTVNLEVRYGYDDAGRLLSEVYVDATDGTYQGFVSYIYDDSGRLINIDYDTDGTGTDRRVLISYDESTARTGVSHDLDVDGRPDWACHFPIQCVDGAENECVCLSTETGTHGETLRQQISMGGIELPTRDIEFRYDSQLRLRGRITSTVWGTENCRVDPPCERPWMDCSFDCQFRPFEAVDASNDVEPGASDEGEQTPPSTEP